MLKLIKCIIIAVFVVSISITGVSAKEVERVFSAIYLFPFSEEDFIKYQFKKYCESNKSIRVEHYFVDNGSAESVFDPKLGAGVPERGIFDKENARLLYDDEYLKRYLKKFNIENFDKQVFMTSTWFDGYMLYIMSDDKEYIMLLPSKLH